MSAFATAVAAMNTALLATFGEVVSYAQFTRTPLTGTIDPVASTAVTGIGTKFLTELIAGDQISVSGETRTVATIASDVSATVTVAFSNNANDTSPDKLVTTTTAPRVIWIEGELASARKPGAAAIATARLSDFAVTPVKGDEITRGGALYRVMEDPRNSIDGLGLTCDLVLRKV